MTTTLKPLFQKNPKGFFKASIDLKGKMIRGIFRGYAIAEFIDAGGNVVEATVHYPKSRKLSQEEILRLKELIIVGSSGVKAVDFKLLEKGWVAPGGDDIIEPIDRAYHWLYDAYGCVKPEWL